MSAVPLKWIVCDLQQLLEFVHITCTWFSLVPFIYDKAAKHSDLFKASEICWERNVHITQTLLSTTYLSSFPHINVQVDINRSEFHVGNNSASQYMKYCFKIYFLKRPQDIFLKINSLLYSFTVSFRFTLLLRQYMANKHNWDSGTCTTAFDSFITDTLCQNNLTSSH